MKVLKGLLITLLTLVVLAFGAAAGGYFYVKGAYGIDLIKTIQAVSTLQKETDESELCPYAFTDADRVSAKDVVNASVADLVTYDGTDYAVNFDGLVVPMTSTITLTDKQTGALAQTVVKQKTGGSIEFGGKRVDVEIKQMQFSSATAQSVLLGVVVQVDMTPFIADMSDEFPISIIKGWIPETLYVASTVRVEHGAEAFSYTVSHESLKVNYLDAEQTADFFHVLDVVFSAGEAEDWNVQVGTTIVDCLIGAPSNEGLAYALSYIGATDYAFGEGTFSVLK